MTAQLELNCQRTDTFTQRAQHAELQFRAAYLGVKPMACLQFSRVKLAVLLASSAPLASTYSFKHLLNSAKHHAATAIAALCVSNLMAGRQLWQQDRIRVATSLQLYTGTCHADTESKDCKPCNSAPMHSLASGKLGSELLQRPPEPLIGVSFVRVRAQAEVHMIYASG